MIRKKKAPSIDKLGLSNPQKAAVKRLLSGVRSKYKKLLHETHERLHIIADPTSSLEFWYNVNGNYEYVSPSCKEVLGYDPEEFTHNGLLFEKIVHEDCLEQFRQDRARAFAGESGVDSEYRMYTKSRDIRYLLMSWSPVITRKGKHIGIRISLRDISDFKRCQHFSQAYRELTLSIADELTHTGVFSMSPEQTLLSWSAAAARIFGWSKEEAIGRQFAELFPGAVDTVRSGLDAMDCGDRFSTELLLKTRDGREIAIRLLVLPLCDIESTLHRYTFLVYPLT